MRSVANGQNGLKRASHDGDITETPNKLTRLRKRQKVLEPPLDHVSELSRPLILPKPPRYPEAAIAEDDRYSRSPNANADDANRSDRSLVVTPPCKNKHNAIDHSISGTKHVSRRQTSINSVDPVSEDRQVASAIQESHLDADSVASSSGSLSRSASLPTLSREHAHSPSTPKKRARDLSQLFNMSPSPSKLPGTPKTGGIAKRMLHRSHTDTSTTTSSGRLSSLASRQDQKVTLHDSPQASATDPFTTPTKKSTSADASPSLGTGHHTPVTPHTYTYAGKSRSFLIAVPTSKLGSLRENGVPDEDAIGEEFGDDFEMRESYTDLRNRWGVDNSEDDPRPSDSLPDVNGKRRGKASAAPSPLPSLPDGMANDLKSISELRSKGESRRFLDEVGYLFEGLDPTGRISLRRASALEIVTKLCDFEFARKAKATDFLSRAWDVCRESRANDCDKVLDVTLAFFAALVARDPMSLSELADKPDFVSTLLAMLSSVRRETDILVLAASGASDIALKKMGVSKTEKASLKNLHNVITKSGLFSEGLPISTPLLVSRALVSVPPPTLRPVHVTTIRLSLLSELSLVSPRVDAYLTGLPLWPTSSTAHLETPSVEHITNCLYLLDSFLLRQWHQTNEDDLSEDTFSGHDDELARGLIALCCFSEALMNSDSSYDIAHKCIEITLRVLISFSHENRSWCQGLLRQELTVPFVMRTIVHSHSQRIGAISAIDAEAQPENDEDAQPLDRLCLALGLLTNMVQSTEEAKEQCRETLIDPACASKLKCIRGCHCKNRVTALECLKSVYLREKEGGDNMDLSAGLLRGHIAVLFGLLMRGNNANRSIILKTLPGTRDIIKVESLLHEAREFVNFYTDLTSRLATATSEGSEQDGYDGKAPAPLWRDCTVERMIRDGKSDRVAREVISFLESLC